MSLLIYSPRTDEEAGQSLCPLGAWSPISEGNVHSVLTQCLHLFGRDSPFFGFSGQKANLHKEPCFGLAPFHLQRAEGLVWRSEAEQQNSPPLPDPSLGASFPFCSPETPGPWLRHRQVRSLPDWQTALRHGGQGQIVTRLHGFPPPGGAGDA